MMDDGRWMRTESNEVGVKRAPIVLIITKAYGFIT
jgi:hypothetical protein